MTGPRRWSLVSGVVLSSWGGSLDSLRPARIFEAPDKTSLKTKQPNPRPSAASFLLSACGIRQSVVEQSDENYQAGACCVAAGTSGFASGNQAPEAA